MSGGDGTITGSAASQVLDLNVYPSSPFSPDEVALELALGEQRSSVHSRQKLPPRFDPGMSSDLGLRHASRVSNDLLDRSTYPLEIPVLAPDMRLHGDVSSSSIHAVSTYTSACMRYGDETQCHIPAISASVLHCHTRDPMVSGVSSDYDTCPSFNSLSAAQRVLSDFVCDSASPNVSSRELVDVFHDFPSPLVMPSMSAGLYDNGPNLPISRNLSHGRTSTFTTLRGRSHFHDGTHPTANDAMLEGLNVCASPSQLSCEDRPGPCPIRKIRPSTLFDERSSLSVPLFPLGLRERRSPLFPMHRLLNDLSRQSTGPSAAPVQASTAEHRNLESLRDDLGSFPTSTRRLSRRPLRWRRARRRIASLLNQAEVEALSTGAAFTGEASRADDIIPRSGMPDFSTCEDAGTSGLVRSSSASFLQSSESSHDDVKEANTGNVSVPFECNICLEMATEPVVSCCGHLFCWWCLHQWLYVHSIVRDCPVCKGFLPDSAIIPIYGRGNVEVRKRPSGSSPPCPSGHRLGSVTCEGDQDLQERLWRGMNLSAEEIRANTRSERNDLEASTSTFSIFVQRVQQAYLDRRSRLGQRLMQRQGERIRSHEESIATTEVTVNSVFSQTRELEESARQSLEMATENLAAIRARIDGLRANMQGLVEFVNSAPRGSGIPSSEERRRSSPPIVVEILSDEEEESLRDDLIPNGNVISTSGQVRERSMESLRDLHRGATSGSSGSCNAEPGLSHTRKRRRLD